MKKPLPSGAFIHPLACVESRDVGPGTRVWAFAHILKGARIGSGCNIGDHVFIESGVVLGDDVTVKNGVLLFNGVEIRSGAFIGPGVVFTNDRFPRSRRWPKLGLSTREDDWLVRCRVEEGASLGANVTVLGGVTIGRFALVGAGSVVTSSVPPYGLGYGNPFRLRGYACACGRPVSTRPRRATCKACGRMLDLRRRSTV